MSRSNTPSLYFNITDIVDFAKKNTRVTGIQRVVVNVIGRASEKYGHASVRCIFYDRTRKSIMECDPTIFSLDTEFDSERLLYKLGLLRSWKVLPSDLQVKVYLQRYRKNKLLRLIRLADIYLSAIFLPSRLHKMQLQRVKDRFTGDANLALHRFNGINSDASLVLLGVNWSCEQIAALAKSHADNGGDVVQMIYDLIPYRFPQYVSARYANTFNSWLHSIALYRSRFMCISECTANDLRLFLESHGTDGKMVVTPLAHEVVGFERNACVQFQSTNIKALINRDYILCVGTIEVRKNGAMLLRAWMRLSAELNKELPLLVFAGKRGWLTEEFNSLMEAHTILQRCVVIIDSPSDHDLACLYSNCLFTVFPSVYEGWGLPVGESAWFGKYCIASNASSIPEVCGDLMDYIDPSNLEDITAKLRTVLLDRDYVQLREERIVAAPLRTWEDVAKDIQNFLTGAEESLIKS